MPDADEFDGHAVPPADSPGDVSTAPQEDDPSEMSGYTDQPQPPPESEGAKAEQHYVGTVADSGQPKEFDPRYREKLNGLMFIGYLEDEFWWMGHRFVMRTIDADDVLAIALIHQKYVSTIGDVKAYQRAVVAAALISVDGNPLPEPLGPEAESNRLEPRFAYAGRWYPVTIDALYTKYLELESEVGEVMKRMGEASG